jgi:hypothetical protein
MPIGVVTADLGSGLRRHGITSSTNQETFSLIGRLNSLIVRFISLFDRFISLFSRLGNSTAAAQENQRLAGTDSVVEGPEVGFFAVSSR